MVNITMLADKYKQLVNAPKEVFITEANKIRSNKLINEINFPANKPVLIYNKGNKNVVYYLLGMHYSLQRDRVLDYAITTGQNFINQHFLTEANRDLELHDKIYYSDLVFISLSQFDYTSEYLESLIIDLVETRQTRGLDTVIYYDVLDTNNYISTTSKLYAYFNSVHKSIDLAKAYKTEIRARPKGERFI